MIMVIVAVLSTIVLLLTSHCFTIFFARFRHFLGEILARFGHQNLFRNVPKLFWGLALFLWGWFFGDFVECSFLKDRCNILVLIWLFDSGVGILDRLLLLICRVSEEVKCVNQLIVCVSLIYFLLKLLHFLNLGPICLFFQGVSQVAELQYTEDVKLLTSVHKVSLRDSTRWSGLGLVCATNLSAKVSDYIRSESIPVNYLPVELSLVNLGFASVVIANQLLRGVHGEEKEWKVHKNGQDAIKLLSRQLRFSQYVLTWVVASIAWSGYLASWVQEVCFLE